MMDEINATNGGSLFAARYETAKEIGGQVRKGEDVVVISIKPPYATEEEYIELTIPEALALAERLLHLSLHSEETIPETDENGIPIFINPIEKSLYE